ncbi:MAG: M42 family metallopeptidase [Anaerolineales bacterium]|nr:M42 family metallopeptidase [Chloroflexota bacterium]MBL6980923.1 M42 family metallopeptidase [Anaerolineales bacterium]
MKKLPDLDIQYMLDFLTGLLETPSPTGFTQAAIEYTETAFRKFSFLEISRTRKGGLVVIWPGDPSTSPSETGQTDSPRGVTAHTDTLGAMVKEVKPNGRLKLTKIGGFPWNTVEGEGCTVFTRDGGQVRGSLLLKMASVHVYGKKVGDTKRDDDNVEVRLDALTTSVDETRALGIEVGDFVAFDPRVELTNGFVRSRHLDDKACVANILAAVKAFADAGLKPAQTTIILISNYEEAGHGASAGFPPDMTELLTVDMAAVGDGQTSDEFHTTLCVKDSGGPYHHGLNQKLRNLADQYEIPYKVDIYPYYGSDGEAFWRAGGDVAVSLIGPGVDASHNYERTHTDALVATTNWIMAYLLSE